MGNRRPWTKDEEDYLIKHRHDTCASTIGIILNRSKQSINAKACILKIKQERRKDRQRPPGHASYNYFFNRLNQNSLSRNRLMTLSLDEFKDITAQECSYCGDSPVLRNSYVNASGKGRNKNCDLPQETIDRNWIKINGIDRKDNLLGYTKENSIACCKTCNWAKGGLEVKEFSDWINRVVIKNQGFLNE